MTAADSDVLIDALRGAEPSTSRVKGAIRDGVLATTAVTAFELLAGARGDRERAQVAALLGPLEILPLDAAAAAAAAGIHLDLVSSGRGIGMADCLIAGICLTRSIALLTRDIAHFERVPGLRLA